jgi:hypothetical protein
VRFNSGGKHRFLNHHLEKIHTTHITLN